MPNTVGIYLLRGLEINHPIGFTWCGGHVWLLGQAIPFGIALSQDIMPAEAPCQAGMQLRTIHTKGEKL